MTVSSDNIAKTEHIERLRRTADYRAMRSARRRHSPTFTLQVQQRVGQPAGPNPVAAVCDGCARFGLTVTKRIGNAVERNRIKRRLRAAISACAGGKASRGFDYVLVAKRPALTQPFDEIVGHLAEALDRTGRLGANPRRDPPRDDATGKPRKTQRRNRKANG